MTQKLNLPTNNVAVNGSCGDKEQTIILSWNTTMGSSNDSFTLHFKKNEKKYTLHHMELVILPQELPKYNSTSSKNKQNKLKFNYLLIVKFFLLFFFRSNFKIRTRD